MVTIEKALEYNREMKETLSEMWTLIPKGQQKQILKKDRIRENLIRFKIVEEDKG